MNKSRYTQLFSIAAIVSLSLISNTSFGQILHHFQSAETSIELGLGGANLGLQGKINHHWTSSDRLTTMSSLSFSSFWGQIGNYTQYYPSLAALSDISGFRTDNHLRLYSGAKIALFSKRKLQLSAEAYLGGYHAFMSGKHFHERLQINQDYSASQFFFDYGTRFGINYKVNDQIGILATLNNSWRQLGYGYRILPMLYQYNPDNKMSFGLGVTYNLKSE
jgi:hypothetical protein